MRGREGAAAGTLSHYGRRGRFARTPVDHDGVRVLGTDIREAAGYGDRTVFVDYGGIDTQARHHGIHVLDDRRQGVAVGAAIVVDKCDADGVVVLERSRWIIVHVLVRDAEASAGHGNAQRRRFAGPPVNIDRVGVQRSDVTEGSDHGDRSIFVDHRGDVQGLDHGIHILDPHAGRFRRAA